MSERTKKISNSAKRVVVGAGIAGALFGGNVVAASAAAEKPATEAALEAVIDTNLYSGGEVPTLQGSCVVVDKKSGKSLTSVNRPLVVPRTEAGEEMMRSGNVHLADTENFAVGYITRDEHPHAVLFTKKDQKSHRFVFNVKRGINGAVIPAIMNVHFPFKGEGLNSTPDLSQPLNGANQVIHDAAFNGSTQTVAAKIPTGGYLNLGAANR